MPHPDSQMQARGDTAQQQAHSREASGAAMRALRSVGADSAGRAAELDDDLHHDMEGEPSSIQGLLDAIAFIPGYLSHPLLTSAPADHLLLTLGSPIIVGSVSGMGALLRPFD